MNLIQRMIKKKYLVWINLIRPRRALNSLLTLLSFNLKLLKPWGQPVAVDIEPTNFCNLKCQHCQVSHWQKPKRRLTMDQFSSWIKQFETASRIKLQGMGEPFLNKELPSIIKQLEKDHFYIEVVSNGTVMTDEIYEVVTQTRHFNLTISFDGADKKTFESIRLGSDFDEIKAHLTKIIQAKPRRSKVSASIVGFKEHQEQIKPTIELLGDLGVDEVYLQLIVINFGQDSLDERTVEHRIQMKNQTDPFKIDLYETAKQKGLKMDIADRLFDEESPCPWPWLGTYIDTEGYVIPCCHIGNAEICHFGNLNQQDFRTIWHSKEYQQLREQIKTNRIPHFCRSCYRSAPLEREGHNTRPPSTLP
ncbi:MAG: radical SAM protein [Syntrophaceae bacterium]|nr:radical SAM protein [Syntrophaceae bacterium]